MTGTQLWHVMQGAHAFYPSWPGNLTEDQNDLIAGFLDNLRDWMDVSSFDDSYRAGRDAARHLGELIKELREAGLFVGARRRHCLITGGIREPSSWLVFDVEVQAVREAELVDENGRRIWSASAPEDESSPQRGQRPRDAGEFT